MTILQVEEFANPSAMKDVTDWQDEVFRTASMQSYNVSLTGGGENNNYNLGLLLKTMMVF